MPDNVLTDSDRRAALRAYKDAKAKSDALEARMRDEEQQAEAEGREPIAIQPLTSIPAPLVVKAIATISGDVSKELGDIIGGQRKACGKVGNATVAISSEHLKLILEAAGLGEQEKPAPPVPVAPEPKKTEDLNALV